MLDGMRSEKVNPGDFGRFAREPGQADSDANVKIPEGRGSKDCLREGLLTGAMAATGEGLPTPRPTVQEARPAAPVTSPGPSRGKPSKWEAARPGDVVKHATLGFLATIREIRQADVVVESAGVGTVVVPMTERKNYKIVAKAM